MAAASIRSRTAPPTCRSRWSGSSRGDCDPLSRSFMAGPTQAEIPSQLGRTAVVTGATGGLGYETALALAKAGTEVILTGRYDAKGQSAVDKISREVTDARVSYQHLDLASLASVADFAQRMHARQSVDL